MGREDAWHKGAKRGESYATHSHTHRQWTNEITIYRKRRRLLKINTILLPTAVMLCVVRVLLTIPRRCRHTSARTPTRNTTFIRRTAVGWGVGSVPRRPPSDRRVCHFPAPTLQRFVKRRAARSTLYIYTRLFRMNGPRRQ